MTSTSTSTHTTWGDSNTTPIVIPSSSPPTLTPKSTTTTTTITKSASTVIPHHSKRPLSDDTEDTKTIDDIEVATNVNAARTKIKRTKVSSVVSSVPQTHEWFSLDVSTDELRCSMTLNSGQCFQWHELILPSFTAATRQWIGVIDDWILILQERDSGTWVSHIRSPDVKGSNANVVDVQSTSATTPNAAAICARLHSYFQLSFSLTKLISEWTKADPTFFGIQCRHKPGLRLLQLDPFECLISFITSANNNIPRIHKLMDSFRAEYGTKVGTYNSVDYYRFPTVNEIIKSIDVDRLTELGFGYRARFLYDTIHTLHRQGGESFLLDLRRKRQDSQLSSSQIAMTLRALFMGVGPKVADCITLMSLNGYDCVPVDTHIFQLYQNVYQPSSTTITTTTAVVTTTKTKTKNPTSTKLMKKKKSSSSLTSQQYKNVQLFFQRRFGSMAGWAQSYLFVTQISPIALQ